MSRKFLIIFAFWVLALPWLTCRFSKLVQERSTPAPTPTILVARFTTFTPTATTMPSATPTPAATATPTPLPSPTVTPTLLPSPTSTRRQVEPTATASPPGQTGSASDRLIQLPTDTPMPTNTSRPAPAASPTPTSPPPLSGRIAFPVDDQLGHYDIWMVELPKGEPFFVLGRARQPNFSNTGQLLVNNETSPQGENLGWLDANNTWLGLVSDTPEDRHPFWSPDGSRYVYTNPKLLTDPNTLEYLSYLFSPCSMRRPSEEGDDKCRDTGGKSKLGPGAYPVWTDDNRIAFFADLGGAGIYLVSAGATVRDYEKAAPQRVILTGDGRPSDTQGHRLYFSASSLNQNWEAYMINLDGSGLVNLSNSPTTYDGLPTVSPDGAWVAFVSNRNKHWGIWVVSSSGGEPFELVDLSQLNPNPLPWGQEEREWTQERLTWGP